MTAITTVNSEVQLKQYVEQHSATLSAQVQTELSAQETEYNKARQKRTEGVYVLVLGFVGMLPFTFVPFLKIVGVGLFCVAVFYGLRLILINQHTISKFHQTLDRVIFEKVFALLGIIGSVQLQPTGADPAGLFAVRSFASFYSVLQNLNRDREVRAQSVLQRLAGSELITEPYNRSEVDTEMSVLVTNKQVTITELEIKQVTGSGKNSQTRQIFHGYFVCMPLEKALFGKTFVTAEGDTHGFGGVGHWGSTTNQGPKETVLEWNEFEDKLHVATTNETEARYVLTPDFMQCLFDWWKEHDTRIRVSFIGRYMYVLFPDDKVRMGYGFNAELNKESLAEYVYSIARPLWQVIRLINKVRL